MNVHDGPIYIPENEHGEAILRALDAIATRVERADSAQEVA